MVKKLSTLILIVITQAIFADINKEEASTEQIDRICSPDLTNVTVGNNLIINIKCDKNDEKATEHIKRCLSSSVELSTSCRAFKKARFHSSPTASCSMKITAPKDHFFPHETVFVKTEYYRNITGASAKLALLPVKLKYQDRNVITGFQGSIGCVNAAGIGRTCESKATVTAYAFPLSCSPYVQQIKEKL